MRSRHESALSLRCFRQLMNIRTCHRFAALPWRRLARLRSFSDMKAVTWLNNQRASLAQDQADSIFATESQWPSGSRNHLLTRASHRKRRLVPTACRLGSAAPRTSCPVFRQRIGVDDDGLASQCPGPNGDFVAAVAVHREVFFLHPAFILRGGKAR